MPTITSIKQQKNKRSLARQEPGKDRVNVYLDGKFAFGIDLMNFVQLHLRVGQELSEREVAEIVKKAEFQKILDKLLRFAMVRPRSEKEINDYLKRKKVHESLHRALFHKLKHFELLDDEKFAKWWVEQRQAFKPKSLRVLKQELELKGIDKEVIERVLKETKIDEEELARELLAKKAYKWERLEPRVARQKKSQYLAGKGFSWEVIEKVTSK